MRITFWRMLLVGASICGQESKRSVGVSSRRQVGAVDLFDRVLERPARQGGAGCENESCAYRSSLGLS